MIDAWNEPEVVLVHLANGDEVLTEVNGKDWSGTSGFIFAQGQEREVERPAGAQAWTEVRA